MHSAGLSLSIDRTMATAGGRVGLVAWLRVPPMPSET